MPLKITPTKSNDYERNNMKKLTKEEFIAKARDIHGDNYDYSISEYKNTRSKIAIRCTKHNYIFHQKALDHLQGCGCPMCWNERRRKGAVGIGIMDIDNESYSICGSMWRNMIARCYGLSDLKKHPTYKDCDVCDEWLIFSNFKKWFDENYVEGYQLDKDILQKGNKVYSPDTCCFVPHEINKLIITANRKESQLPVGVRKVPYGYQTFVSINGHPNYLGTCKTEDEASELYLRSKAKHIADMAFEYYNRGDIAQKIYHGLLRFSQSLTDKIKKL